jgi:hypothetical protein
MGFRTTTVGLAAILTLSAAPELAAQAPAGLAGRTCPRTVGGQPSYLYGFTAAGALLCAPAVWAPDACDGVDNNVNGLTDEFLYYCVAGASRPNSDGRACLTGFADRNRDPADGCETTGPAEETAGRVLGTTAAAQRLDGASTAEQVVLFVPGKSLSIQFRVMTADGRTQLNRPVFSSAGTPSCPHAVFTDGDDGLDLRIDNPRTPTAGGDCRILRAYASSRTPQVFATIEFVLRVRAAP